MEIGGKCFDDGIAPRPTFLLVVDSLPDIPIDLDELLSERFVDHQPELPGMETALAFEGDISTDKSDSIDVPAER